MPTPVECPDSSFTANEVESWAEFNEWTSAQSAVELGLGVSAGVVTIIDTSDQAKRNRNRAKAILKLWGG